VKILGNTVKLAHALLCFGILSSFIIIHPGLQPALANDDLSLDLNFAPSIVEAGTENYSIGYVRLMSNSTGQPVIATSDLEIRLASGDASIAFVPSRVFIPAGSDYAQFSVEVSDLPGQTEISAYYGNMIVNRTFKVVDAVSLVDDIDLVINLASDKMQIDTEMPFSVYLENKGNIVQAQKDITVGFSYESSLVTLGSNSVVIKKGSYYATDTIKTLEKSGNAFIKATTSVASNGELLNTVTNVAISQTQPASLKVYVFPDKVGLNEKTIDIFVGVIDAAGQPTLASEDIKLELFSSAYQVAGIADVPAVIKKGEFGFHTRLYMNFYQSQTVTVGASASGLGAGTTSFEVLEDSLDISQRKALDKELKVFTVENMPSAADSIVVYQLNAIEHDADDVDCNANGDLADDGDDCNGDGLFDVQRDTNRDGIVDGKDWHPIDDLDEGALYPIESTSIFSSGQGNVNVVSGNNLAARVVDPGYIAAGASYGTAKISSAGRIENVYFSVSLTNIAVGSNSINVVGGLNPTQTKIFSPAGVWTVGILGEVPGNEIGQIDSGTLGMYRVIFDRDGNSDLYFVTLDSAGRPSNSEQGVKYLIKPINELTEIKPGTSFGSLRVEIDSFKSGSVIPQNTIKDLSAVPVGVNADSNLEKTSSMHLLFYTGTSTSVLLPFNNVIAFSKVHQIGAIQLRDMSGNPVLAADDTAVKLTSSSPNVLPANTVIIPAGKSFTTFEVATLGKADNFTIYATADGLQSSSTMFAPAVAELPATFVGTSAFTTSVPASITVSSPIQGASITWGASTGLKLSNTTTFASAGNSYSATIQVVADNPGTYAVDASLVKDGFKPTRISKEVTIGLFQKQMNAILVDNGVTKLAQGQPVLMKVLVQDSSGMPVPDATVNVEDSSAQGIILVTSVTTDTTGSASFMYTPTSMDDGSSNLLTLMVTATKEGFTPTRDSKVFEIDHSPVILPPIPVIGSAFAGLPSWGGYAILGGIAAVGSGVYMLKKEKNPEDEESLVEDGGAIKELTDQEAIDVTKEPVEDALEDEEEEEET